MDEAIGQAIGHAVVGHEVGIFVEPEMGYLRVHFAFARVAVGQHDINRAHTIGGDEEEMLSHIENLADFATFNFGQFGNFQFK